tara:strand:+ start:2811 stop:4031 length:1221 start_codon:yes stop_codon:yes gene_type:complete
MGLFPKSKRKSTAQRNRLPIPMKKTLLFSFFFILILGNTQAQEVKTPSHWPDAFSSGDQGKMHVQGMALDKKNGFIYLSFTDRLIKMDLSGRTVGSVSGFIGHLGDLDFNDEDGKIYGSLEYKNDAIGKGIKKTLGMEENAGVNGFYIAIFEGSKIIREDMNAETEDLLRTVYLAEVVQDYEAEVAVGDNFILHRFACSGIDGLTFAPSIGSSNLDKKYLYVAYGIYGDLERDDNDHQVILKYDVSNWSKYVKQLSQDKLHTSGPKKPKGKYFIKTGNTRYGIQNLAYDSHTGNLFAAVYKGNKTQFPNYDLFVIDGHQKPISSRISSDNKKIKVKTLSLLQAGPKDSDTGIRGWHFKWGATGIQSLGDGLFYISHNEKGDNGLQRTTLYKYRWVGDSQNAFVRDN